MNDHLEFLPVGNGIQLRYGVFFPPKKTVAGTVVLLQGRSEFMEKYFETIEELNAMDLDVAAFDWRGQGLSSRLLENRRKGHIDHYQSYIDDLTVFMEKVVLPRARHPLILMGHSMGGHIGFRFLHDHQDLFDGAVLLCPMFDIRIFRLFKLPAINLARWMVLAGYGNVYGAGGDNPMEDRFEENSLTSDPARFSRTSKLTEKNPDLAIGGATFGWFHASFESIDIINDPDYIKAVHTPILVVSGGDDRVVSNDSTRRACQLLPRCRHVTIPGSRHEILQEKDEVRDSFWKSFTGFFHEIIEQDSRKSLEE